jgi:hypothetical protein
MTHYGSLTHPLCGRYVTLYDRLKSYKHASEKLQKVITMHGFYYTGDRYSTFFFFCGFGLKDWRDSDKPCDDPLGAPELVLQGISLRL